MSLLSPVGEPDTARRAAPVTATIHVCTTCRVPGDPDAADRPGARLLAALSAALLRRPEAADARFTIQAVECLSVCKRPCTVAFAAPGKWTYVYADLAPETAADTILAGAALYADAPDGIIPWRQRPDALKRGVVARIPPLPAES